MCLCAEYPQFSLLIGPSFLAFAPSAFSSSQIHLSLSIHVAPGNQSGGGGLHMDVMRGGREGVKK